MYFIRKKLSKYNPKIIIMQKHEWMNCDHIGAFLFEPEVPETIMIKTISTKLSKFPKISHTIHNNHVLGPHASLSLAQR